LRQPANGRGFFASFTVTRFLVLLVLARPLQPKPIIEAPRAPPEPPMLVQDIMTPNPYSVSVTTSVRQVLHALAEADVRHLPVVDEGALVGIVSDRDLRALGTLDGELSRPSAVREALAQPASSVMSANVITVNPESDVAEAIDLMIEHRIGALPVVEADSTKLVGIVSYVDALRAARDIM
jgi:acetoin utilization protein AcuB